MRHNLTGDFPLIKASTCGVRDTAGGSHVKEERGRKKMKLRRKEEENKAVTPYIN